MGGVTGGGDSGVAGKDPKRNGLEMLWIWGGLSWLWVWVVVGGVLWVTVEGVMKGGWVVGGGVGEGGEGPCEYVGKRGMMPMNDVFVEEEIYS